MLITESHFNEIQLRLDWKKKKVENVREVFLKHVLFSVNLTEYGFKVS